MPNLRTKKRVDYAKEPDSDGEDCSLPSSDDSSAPKKPVVPIKRIKQEIEEDDDDECEYERLQKKAIQERNELLIKMGIIEARDNFLKSVQPLKSEEPKKPKTPRASWRSKLVDLPKREPSRRLQKLKAVESFKEEDVKKEEEPDQDNRLLGSMKIENDSALIFSNLNSDAKFNPHLNLTNCDLESYRIQLSSLTITEESLPKLTNKRIQSLHIHPSMSKCLVLAGSCGGQLGVWDADAKTDENILQFSFHTCPLNCISTCSTDHSKIYTTSHDGTVVRMDIDHGQFDNIYATDYYQHINHLTWHEERDPNTLLIAHGNGSVGMIDLRDKENVSLLNCFERSCRTVQMHPTNNNYFLSSSSTKQCEIFDLRTINKSNIEPVFSMPHPKGLTSAFFSNSGDRIVTTCNDDRVRIYDSSKLDKDPKVIHTVIHNNHTGRWLSVFKAMWLPKRDDIFVIGSLMHPRRMQFYGVDGKIQIELAHDKLGTVVPVIAMHPTLPFIAGGNSSGRVHLFRPPDSIKIEDQKIEIEDQKIKIEDQEIEIEDQKIKIEDQKIKIENQFN